MSGKLYKIIVGVDAIDAESTQIYLYAGLDTCSGNNFIRRNQIHLGVKIQPFRDSPNIETAQGARMDTMGFVSLLLTVCGTQSSISVSFLVVEKLVVPMILETPWISEHTSSINPIKKTLTMLSPSSEELTEVPLGVEHNSQSEMVRAYASHVVPAFSEAWIDFRCNATCLSVLSPPNRHEKWAQLKNGVK
jgi:hypothetical protein